MINKMDIETGHTPSFPHTINIDPRSLLIDGIPSTITLDKDHISFSSINQSPNIVIPYSEILCALPANKPHPLHNLSNPLQPCFDFLFTTITTNYTPSHLTDAHIFTFRRSLSHPSEWHPLKLIISSTKEFIDDILTAISTGIASISSCRPRRLLILINPCSGKGASRPAFTTIIKPVLTLAGIQMIVYETEYQGHAREMVTSVLSEDRCVDGIIAVGGDGVFNEVLNGYMDVLTTMHSGNSNSSSNSNRIGSDDTSIITTSLIHNNNINNTITFDSDELHRLHDIRLAHIPCGSTDAVACSLNGNRSIFTAIMHVALGDSMLFDILRIDTKKKEGQHSDRRWSSCIATLGFMSDVVQRAGEYNWLMRGTLRYDVLGAAMLIRNASYKYRIEYMLSTVEESLSPCYARCDVCRAASLFSNNNRILTSSPFLLSSQHESKEKESSWISLQGEFMSVMAINQPCRSDKTPLGMSRYGHLSNGQCTLVLVDKCSAWQYLRFLMTMSSQGLVPGILPDYVKVINNIIAMKVYPINNNNHDDDNGFQSSSYWNIDGELVEPCAVTTIHSCNGLVKVFGRGIER